MTAQSQTNRWRVAIAGLGRSGWKIHTNCLRKLSGQYQIVAAADQLPERREDARAEFQARVYDDWEALVADGDYDLFVNALPSPLHVPATLAALEAGKHVLCEKPMARNVTEFDQMVACARKHNRILAPFQNNRLQPFFDQIRNVLTSGVLGDLVYIRSRWGGFRRRWDWQTWQDNLGGSLYNTGPHAVDQALALLNWQKPEVFCRMNCRNPFGADAEDHCTVTLYDPQRQAPQVDIIISAYMAFEQGDAYNICGTYGGLTGGATELTWRYFDPAAAPKHDMWTWSVNRQYTREELPWQEESWSLAEAKRKQAVGYTLVSFPSGPERIYKNLYDVLHGNSELLINPDQVRPQIEILEECHRQNPLPRTR